LLACSTVDIIEGLIQKGYSVQLWQNNQTKHANNSQKKNKNKKKQTKAKQNATPPDNLHVLSISCAKTTGIPSLKSVYLTFLRYVTL